MLPVSVVIPTCDRPAVLLRTVGSLLAGSEVPQEFVIVDASAVDNAEPLRALFAAPGAPRLIMRNATTKGAAAQRNEGVALATCGFILFCDDDIVVEPDVLRHLWLALFADPGIGAAAGTIVNQSYTRPGAITRTVLALIGAPEGKSYAGRVVGPALAFLPSVGDAMHQAAVEWLNLGCTLYRRELLPSPCFDAFFTGYSLGEDLALSLRVARKARLAHVPSARIVHDSQPGAHKSNVASVSRTQLVNRYYVMTEVMGKRGAADLLGLIIWECFQIAASACHDRFGRGFWQMAGGRLLGLSDLLFGRGRALPS